MGGVAGSMERRFVSVATFLLALWRLGMAPIEMLVFYMVGSQILS